MIRALVLLACLAAPPVQAATVFISVTGVRNDHGSIRVALCTKAEFLHPHCAWKANAVAVQGTTELSIPNIPPGTYAAQAFHDENNNGKLDRNILGLPEEAMGFSNNAPIYFGPPRFDVAAFIVGNTDTHISFALRYF